MTVFELVGFLQRVPDWFDVEVITADGWVAADGMIRVVSEIDCSGNDTDSPLSELNKDASN